MDQLLTYQSGLTPEQKSVINNTIEKNWGKDPDKDILIPKLWLRLSDIQWTSIPLKRIMDNIRHELLCERVKAEREKLLRNGEFKKAVELNEKL